MAKQHIIIIGGGYAGVNLAREIDSVADVTLIEQRDMFVHTFPLLRAATDPTWLERACIPYDRLLHHGTVIQAAASHIESNKEGNTVTLSNGCSLYADVVVIATGSKYPRPFKPWGSNVSDLIAANNTLNKQLTTADTIAIVGAGASGIELAGEISSALPHKQVTLITSCHQLLPQFSKKLSTTVIKELKTTGVDVILGCRAKGLISTDTPSKGSLVLKENHELSADLIIPVMGAKPDTTLTQTLHGTTQEKDGRITLDPWLRVKGQSTIFSLGDAAATGDPMTALSITSRQVPWLALTLKNFFHGRPVECNQPYKASRTAPITVALGPRNGVGIKPIAGYGFLLPKRLIVKVKSADLMIGNVRKIFGY